MDVDWDCGAVTGNWVVFLSYLRWTMGFAQITLSHLSTEYVIIPVSATKQGVSYNPTGDVVQFAFMPTAVQQPGNTDWQTGSWDTDSTNILYPYAAKCLVGPTGVINLGTGSYVIYVKIQDNPETPVLVAGQLVIS